MNRQSMVGGLVLSLLFCLALSSQASASTNYWPADGLYGVTRTSSVDTTAGKQCTMQIIKTWYFLNQPKFPASESESCVYDTLYGSYASSGYLQRFVGDYVQLGVSVVPVPNTTKMYSKICGYPCRLYTYDSQQGFQSTTSNYGYRLSPKAPAVPFKLPGQTVAVAIGAMDYSRNGRWLAMQIDSKFFRYDTTTGEFIKFSNGLGSYGVGRDPSFRFSITDDGRYIVLTGTNFAEGLVFDMGKCTPSATYLSPYDTTAQCSSMGLSKIMKAAGYAHKDFFNTAFRSGDREIITHSLNENNVTKGYVIRLNSVEARADYIALGDSFSSGEGDIRDNTRYLPGTDGTSEFPKEKCHISNRSYPYLLQEKQDSGLSFFRSFACSGAITDDIAKISDSYVGHFKQMESNENFADLSNFQTNSYKLDTPGRIPQYKFLEKYQPKNITITIGGNDAGFGNVLSSCVMNSTCEYESLGRASKALELQSKYQVLRDTYRKILNSSPGSNLFVLSYPQFIDDDIQCNPNVPLNADERRFVREGVSYFNKVIRQAALAEGAIYLDIEDSLKGEALCSSKLLNLAVNGVVAGDDTYKVIGQESFHPNSRGHELIASYIAEKYGAFPNSVGERCPSSSCSTYRAPPIPTYFNVLPTTLQRYKYAILEEAKEVFKRGNEIKLKFSSFMPNIVGRVSIHSTPRDLGAVIADGNGLIETTVTIPADIEPGDHEIHLQVKGFDDKVVSYYQPITVIASENDVDGDGVVNGDEKCGFVEPAGTDTDKDLVDDACDPVISVPPIEYKAPTIIKNEPVSAPDPQPQTTQPEEDESDPVLSSDTDTDGPNQTGQNTDGLDQANRVLGATFQTTSSASIASAAAESVNISQDEEAIISQAFVAGAQDARTSALRPASVHKPTESIDRADTEQYGRLAIFIILGVVATILSIIRIRRVRYPSI